MTILDWLFKKNAGQYLLLCGLASLTILVVLILVDVLTYGTVVAALAASTLIVFAMPGSSCTRPRFVVGEHGDCLVERGRLRKLAARSFGTLATGTGEGLPGRGWLGRRAA